MGRADGGRDEVVERWEAEDDGRRVVVTGGASVSLVDVEDDSMLVVIIVCTRVTRAAVYAVLDGAVVDSCCRSCTIPIAVSGVRQTGTAAE